MFLEFLFQDLVTGLREKMKRKKIERISGKLFFAQGKNTTGAVDSCENQSQLCYHVKVPPKY